jgi:Mce-associated membrane protein
MPYLARTRSTVPADDATAGNDQDDLLEAAGPDLNDADDEAASTLSADAEPARRSRRVAVTAMVGLAAIIIGLATWATVAAHHLRDVAADANVAFVDQAATAKVTRDVTAAVNTIFSYSYADTGRTKAAAQGLLTGAAIRQYDALFTLVERQAPKEKLVVTTKVTNVGVEFLTGDRARVLVFADQQDNRAGTSQASYGGAMFAVTVRLEGGRWKIENIDTFTGPA